MKFNLYLYKNTVLLLSIRYLNFKQKTRGINIRNSAVEIKFVTCTDKFMKLTVMTGNINNNIIVHSIIGQNAQQFINYD